MAAPAVDAGGAEPLCSRPHRSTRGETLATFVFVPGAWHAGWCWERVTPLLAAAGHRVVTPDLAGSGSDPTPPSTVTLAGWADQMADIVRRQDEPVVLVGHSRGGIVISETAERVPERIRSLVYLAAFLVPDGETVMTTSAKFPYTRVGEALVAGLEGTTTVRREEVGPIFYNTTEPAWVRRAEDRVGAEPMQAFVTPLALTAERYGAVARAYIECSRDTAIPIALQRLMREALPCDPVYTLEADHSPFYSDPAGLVRCLGEIAAG